MGGGSQEKEKYLVNTCTRACKLENVILLLRERPFPRQNERKLQTILLFSDVALWEKHRYSWQFSIFRFFFLEIICAHFSGCWKLASFLGGNGYWGHLLWWAVVQSKKIMEWGECLPWPLTVSRLHSNYEETVYFLLLSSQEILVLI